MEYKYNIRIGYNSQVTEGLFSDVPLSKWRDTLITIWSADGTRSVGNIKLRLSDEQLPLVWSYGKDGKWINIVSGREITIEAFKFNYSFKC